MKFSLLANSQTASSCSLLSLTSLMSYRATRTKKALGCSRFLPRELGVLTSSGVRNHKSEKVGTDFCLGELIWPFISQFGSRYQKLPLILVAWTSLAGTAYLPMTGKSRLAPKHVQENWVAMCVNLFWMQKVPWLLGNPGLLTQGGHMVR